MTFRFYLSCFILLLTNWQPAIWASQVEQPPFDQVKASEFDRLNAKALTDGSVPVMVIMKDAEGDDTLPKSQQQEAIRENTISKAQDAVLAKLPASKQKSVKRLQTFPIMAMSASVEDLKRLQKSQHVADIIEDELYFPQTLPASVGRIGGDAGWSMGYTGTGQTVAIIDNGIDKNHPYLINKVVKEACFSTNSKAIKAKSTCRKKRSRDTNVGAASVTCPPLIQDNLCSHGTFLASLAAGNSGQANFIASGVAPSANIIALKIDTLVKNKRLCNGLTICKGNFASDLLRALEFIYKQRRSYNIAAVNVGFGDKATPKQCKKNPLKKTIKKLRNANIAIIAASGNNGFTNELNSPACVEGAISVGATGINVDIVESYSNSSSQLNLLAPGGNFDENDKAEKISLIMPGVVGPGEVIYGKGSSLSAALVTGAWAALKSHSPNASVDQILNALTNSGVQLLDPKNGIVKPRIQINQAHALLP